MAFVRTTAVALFSAALFVSVVFRSAKWLVGTGGDLDFIISRSRDPDWVGAAVQWFIAPPEWALAPMLFTGLMAIGINSWYSRRQFLQQMRAALEGGLLDNTERVTGRPSYLRIKYLIHPEVGRLAPAEKVTAGKSEFIRICERATRQNDYEAYLLANHVAEWLHKNARLYFASSVNYQEIAELIDCNMENLHGHFSSISLKAGFK